MNTLNLRTTKVYSFIFSSCLVNWTLLLAQPFKPGAPCMVRWRTSQEPDDQEAQELWAHSCGYRSLIFSTFQLSIFTLQATQPMVLNSPSDTPSIVQRSSLFLSHHFSPDL